MVATEKLSVSFQLAEKPANIKNTNKKFITLGSEI